MAESKMGGLGVLLAFIGALIVLITSVVTFGITADVAFYVYAVEDDSLWTNDLKFINTSAVAIANQSISANTYQVDDTNVNDIYEAAQDTRVDSIENLQLSIAGGNLVVTLVALVIVVGLFFRKNDGILAQLRGMSN